MSHPLSLPYRFLFLLAATLLAGAAWADPPGRVGRIADVQGNVWFRDLEQGEWTQAMRNRPVTTGDRLSTDDGARAELQVGSTLLRLDGSTEVEMLQVDDARVRVQLHHGSAALRVRSPEVASEVEVVTEEGRFMPLGPGHFRLDRQGSSSFAGAWSGEIRFEGSDSALTVGPGRRAEFWPEGGRTHYAWAALEGDAFARWAADEDRRDERAASRYVSPEMTGAEDLDRYGRWESHPEYGALWVPTTVIAGWAPYRMGHWAWVRPWGWTWVDDAPWGFAPFHYGRWVSWRDRWCWVPGRYVARPVYAPALVGWIGGGSVSVGISVGSRGPRVGWVPLGPREPWRPHYHVSPRYERDVNLPHWRGRLPPPAEPVMYTNRGVPGGVTVVPADVLRERRPVAGAVVRDAEGGWRNQQRWRNEVPPPPARVALPRVGEAWGPQGGARVPRDDERRMPRVDDGRGDERRLPRIAPPPNKPPVVSLPAAPAAPAVVVRPPQAVAPIPPHVVRPSIGQEPNSVGNWRDRARGDPSGSTPGQWRGARNEGVPAVVAPRVAPQVVPQPAIPRARERDADGPPRGRGRDDGDGRAGPGFGHGRGGERPEGPPGLRQRQQQTL